MHKSPHRGASVEFAEYRKYVKGDDIRHIDWRAYGRSDRFYLKEFEAETHMRCYLVMDCSASMSYGSGDINKWQYATRLAATLAYLAIHQGDHVGLHCIGDKLVREVPPRGRASHLRHIFTTIDAVKPGGKTQLIEALHDMAEKIHKRALVILFSDLFVDVDPLLACFQHLRHRKHDLAIFHLLDPQELRFDFDRPIRFVDLEEGDSLVTEPVSVREDYNAALQEYLSAIQLGCGQHGSDYRQVNTGTAYEDVLSDFMLARMRR